MARKKTESLHHYTERAIKATEAGALIPPIVYLPRSLRRQKIMLTADNLALTVDPPTMEQNHVKIAASDPVGFIIAVMHGQPVPSFAITKDGGVQIHYEVADLTLRLRAAEYLGHKATIRTTARGKDKQRGADHEAMIARVGVAVGQHNEDEDGVEETPGA